MTLFDPLVVLFDRQISTSAINDRLGLTSFAEVLRSSLGGDALTLLLARSPVQRRVQPWKARRDRGGTWGCDRGAVDLRCSSLFIS